MKDSNYLIKLIAICFIFFAPFLISPSTLSQKDNDLGRTYIPMYSFFKESFYKESSIPFWRSDQMMGESLLANPISAIFYPANIFFLIIPVDFATVLYNLTHLLLAALSTYFLAKTFSFSKLASFAGAIFYAFSTKMLLHLSAGHLTMVAAFAYFPLIIFSIRKLLFKIQYPWVLTAAISSSLMLMLYPTIFYYSAIFTAVYLAYYILQKRPNLKKIISSVIWPVFLVSIISLGLSSIFLLPQIEFAPLSTRDQLKIEDVAVPLFNFKRLISTLVFPYIDFDNFDHESFLYLGFVPTILLLFGFSKLSKFQKIFLFLVGFLTLAFVVGLSSPVFKLSYEMLPFLKYSRVTTRLWFAVALVVALVAAKALDKLKSKNIIYFILLIFLSESFFIAYKKISKTPNLNFANTAIYEYLSQDPELFRVYCTTYCFNPQLTQKYKIQLLNGETPIQDKQTIDFLQKAGNYKHDKFAVIFPPYQVWQTSNPPQPKADLLGKANVKYVVTTYNLISPDFVLRAKFDDFLIYQNSKFLPRVYFQYNPSKTTVKSYESNGVTVEFLPSNEQRTLILSEKYFPDWLVIVNGFKTGVVLHDDLFTKVDIPPNTNNVEIKYLPQSYILGKKISLLTLLLLAIYIWYIKNKKFKWLKLPF